MVEDVMRDAQPVEGGGKVGKTEYWGLKSDIPPKGSQRN